MRLVFAGTPSAAVPSLAALLDSSHDVVAVVTRPDAPSGRGRKFTASPVGALAASAGIEILAPAKPGDPSFLDQLAKLRPDCCPVVAYGSLLPRAALDIPLHGWVNLHFSLLPAWRGAAPVQRALMAGDEVTGATTFRIVEALDAGPTYGQVSEAVRADDTSGALLDRLSLAGAALLVATLDGIEDGTAEATPQPPDGVTLAPKLTVADAEVSWGLPALAVDRCIRACTPAPGAWTTSGQGRLKLAPVVTRADVTSLAPGELAAGKDAVLVGTATDAVQLTSVQPPGKAWMSAPDWVRGQRAVTGRLGR